MEIKLKPSNFFVFDLDDTLYQEIDFLKSAYRHISKKISPSNYEQIFVEMLHQYHQKENVFANLVNSYKNALPNLSTNNLLRIYREHTPELKLSAEVSYFLETVRKLQIPSGLITDGRSITQRNKLKSLGLEDFFQDVIISEEFGSEKPDPKNYLYFQHKYPDRNFYFFGDNTNKDFIIPSQLGWQTVCIKGCGLNIHKQEFKDKSCPKFIISSFREIRFVG